VLLLSARYAQTQRADAYGKTVYRHLSTIIQSMTGKGERRRQGWLRILKDIADFVAATRKKKGGSQEPNSEKPK